MVLYLFQFFRYNIKLNIKANIYTNITMEPVKIYTFIPYDEIRYKNCPNDRTSFLIGNIRRKNDMLGTGLIQMMMLRNKSNDIPTNKQKWRTYQLKAMELKSVTDPSKFMIMEYFKSDDYLIGAELAEKNPRWCEDGDNGTAEDTDRQAQHDNACKMIEQMRNY